MYHKGDTDVDAPLLVPKARLALGAQPLNLKLPGALQRVVRTRTCWYPGMSG